MNTRNNSPSSSLTSVLLAGLLTGLALFTRQAAACGDYHGDLTLIRLAREAVSPNESTATKAITHLRESGPEGLEALFNVHVKEIQQFQYALYSPQPEVDALRIRLCKAIDAVSRQRDGITSRLYWFSDFEKAKAAARSAGKPILSLRLLGHLDEEFSCANSRFFRTALYANAELSTWLREHFVLHWESVRPVPRITIDFGDGRKLERTITGNSIHYVLDAEGQPIDALPGLYGPKAFLVALGHAEAAAKQYAAMTSVERPIFLRQYHSARSSAITVAWSSDLSMVGATGFANGGGAVLNGREPFASPAASVEPATPTAAQAARVAVGKKAVEAPMLRRLSPRATLDNQSLESATSDDAWSKLAALHLEEARLDAASKRLMFRKLDAQTAGRLAVSKAGIEHTLVRIAAPFERSMSEDTVRNEYVLHSKIHHWFAADVPQTRDVAALNERVYTELFLTPSTDPWLGLKPADAYAALEGDGVVK